MKKYILLSLFLCLSFYDLYSQTYSISEKEIEINLVFNDSINTRLIDQLLSDTLLNERLDFIGLRGEFTEVPKNISKINWIKWMEIFSTRDVFIDKTFSEFKDLIGLMVFSKIGSIDVDVVLPKIESIWFVGAIWNEFPKAICNWSSLKEMKIYSGNFPTLPCEIKNLTNLKVLNVGDNQIRFLPEELYSLECLESLLVYNNDIRVISDKICTMKNLRYIILEGNKKMKLGKSIKKCLRGKVMPLLINPDSPYI